MGQRDQGLWVTRAAWRRDDLHPPLPGRRGAARSIAQADDWQAWFAMDPQAARIEAKRLLGLVAAGGDPAKARTTERSAITVAELCDLYLAEGTTHKKASTLRADRGRITHHIKPLIGNTVVAKIGRADIERMMVEVKSGKTAVPPPKDRKRPAGSLPTGGLGAAAQCVALVSTLLEFSVARGYRTDNPAKGIKKPPVRKMDRYLSDEEIARIAVALEAEAKKTGTQFAVGGD